MWVEAYCDQAEALPQCAAWLGQSHRGRWVPIDCVTGLVDQGAKLEASAKPSRPLLYVFAAERDGHVVDVTRRYSRQWSNCVALRRSNRTEAWVDDAVALATRVAAAASNVSTRPSVPKPNCRLCAALRISLGAPEAANECIDLTGSGDDGDGDVVAGVQPTATPHAAASGSAVMCMACCRATALRTRREQEQRELDVLQQLERACAPVFVVPVPGVPFMEKRTVTFKNNLQKFTNKQKASRNKFKPGNTLDRPWGQK